MALVNIANMVVLDNPTCFLNPFQFEITFECLQELQDDLEWKVIYVGSAQDAHQDQILDEILVGPVPVGLNKFVLQADAPNPALLPPNEIVGVTVVLVTCSYREREFVRVGYYVNNEYLSDDEPSPGSAAAPDGSAATSGAEGARSDAGSATDEVPNAALPPPPPTPPPPPPPYPELDLEKVQRHILADKPRVTKFPIPWDNPLSVSHPATGAVEAALESHNPMEESFTSLAAPDQQNRSILMEEEEEDDPTAPPQGESFSSGFSPSAAAVGWRGDDWASKLMGQATKQQQDTPSTMASSVNNNDTEMEA